MDFSVLSVLVVEDHDFQRKLALQMLRSLGVTDLCEASDGARAIELITSSPARPDVIISDLDMPGMDGIEFIRHVAERHLAHAVAITSSLEPAMLKSVETMARAYGLQVLGTIEKPLTARHLTQILALYHKPPGGPQRTPAARPELGADVLRQALEAGEFVPYFQPKIDLRSGKCKGVEALVRWQRPGQEVLLPGVFMPAIEQEGLLDTLTERMLHQSCLAQKGWERSALMLDISVNVSMLSLGDVGIADRYVAMVRRLGADPHLITFEVTEGAVMKDPARALNILARLRLNGFGLSIDDFGTGYSSMQQLGAIPFSELKVDQSFVQGAPDDQRKRTMVETCLELTRKLKIKAVAEGVETRAEWDLLVALGCDQAQGFLISPAMPAQPVPEWVRAWRPPVN